MKNEIIYGINSVIEALKGGNRTFFRLIAVKDGSQRIKEVVALAAAKKVRLEYADLKFINKFCESANHQGIAAEVSALKKYEIFEALTLEKDPKKALWIATDSITDISNLGALIRSAVCFGFSALILPKNRNAGINPAVAKISSGAVERIKIIEVTNLNQAIMELKEKGFWVYGADMGGSDIEKENLAFPLLLVIGSEGEGLHLKTKEHCDKILSIKHKSDFDSLNAATAASIAMYEISKKI